MIVRTHPLSARLVGDPEPRSPEWFTLRRSGITATDLPKIMGLSAYGNALAVWHDKLGQLPDHGREQTSEAATWGNLLEDVVAQEWARRTGNTVSRVGVLASVEQPWALASCDRLIDGRNAALEVKTRSAYVSGKWRDDIPDDVLAQVAWQRFVGGFDYVDVACLIGGQSLSTYRYEEDTDLETLLINSAYQVWEAVQLRVPPPVEWDKVLSQLLTDLYPDRSGEREMSAGEAANLMMAYGSAAGFAKTAELAKEAAKARILEAMGEAEILTYNGEPVFTYRSQPRRSVKLDDLEDTDPDLYTKLLAGGHITTTTSRVLRTGKGAKNVDF